MALQSLFPEDITHLSIYWLTKSLDQMVYGSKHMFKNVVLCTNTYHNDTFFEVDGMV